VITESNILRKALIAVCCTVLYSGAACEENELSFDIPHGHYERLAAADLEFEIEISCNFIIDAAYHGEGWNPMVGILLSSESDLDEDDYGHVARLYAAQFDDEQGWRHEFEVSGDKGRDSRIVAHATTSATVLPLTLTWSPERNVSYLVGDDEDNTTTVDVSNLNLVSLRIHVSGVKGKAACEGFKPADSTSAVVADKLEIGFAAHAVDILMSVLALVVSAVLVLRLRFYGFLLGFVLFIGLSYARVELRYIMNSNWEGGITDIMSLIGSMVIAVFWCGAFLLGRLAYDRRKKKVENNGST
jgi:hypothetical protein